NNVWANLVYTNNGNVGKFYKNGILISTVQSNGNPILSGNAAFGRMNHPAYDAYNGLLDDIGIWNRALTQQEIINLYNAQICTTSVTTNLNISGCGFAVLSNGDTITQSGTYLDTLSTSGGCDSILNQNVTIQPISICNPVPTYVPASGLVGWWGFDGNAQDGSGNGNHGTVNGATLTTDRFGNQNGAYLSNANSTNSITGSCSNFPSGNSPRTISIWYNANGLGSGCCKGFFSYGGGICGNSYLNTFDHLSNGLGKFEIQGHCDFFRQLVDYPQPVNGVWHNVVTIYELDSTFKIFFDGQLLFTSAPVFLNTIVIGKIFNFTGLVNEQGSAPYFDTYWAPFNGKIDDIGIWNR
ncbi:MAG: LamG-like jellyroll fold domain-containing protein, partial [Bacteroidota bacterium]